MTTKISSRKYFPSTAIGAALEAPEAKTPYVRVTFKVVSGPEAGYLKYANRYLNERNQERTIRELRLTGWTGKELGDWTGLGSHLVTLVEDDEEYNGQTQRRILWINEYTPPPSKAKNPPNKKFLDSLKTLVQTTTVDLNPAAKTPAGAKDIAPKLPEPSASAKFDPDPF